MFHIHFIARDSFSVLLNINAHMEVDHDANTDLHKEDDQEEGEEGAQHPGGLLPGAAAAEETHNSDQGPCAQQDVGP